MKPSRNTKADIMQLYEKITVSIAHGDSVKAASRQAGVSAGFYYYWRKKLAARDAPLPETREEALAEENRRLKSLLAEQVLDNELLRDRLEQKASDPR